MSWTDYEAPTAEIPLGNNKTGKVRGLNVDDLSILVTHHLQPISQAVALYAQSRQEVFTKASLHGFIVKVAADFPGLLSEVISLAADEPTLKGKKLAMGVQIAAMNEIARLTLEEVGGLGNLSLVLGNLVKGALGGGNLPVTPANGAQSETMSPASIGASEKT